jgi:hypothetical protein
MKAYSKLKTYILLFALAALAVNLTSCATTSFMFRQPGVEELKYKKITQADPSFWKGVDSIRTSSQSNLSITGIDAAIGGDIDLGGTCSSTVKSVVPAVLLGGFNPVGSVVMLAQLAAEGPQRKADTSFKDNVNTALGSYDWDSYFEEVLREKFAAVSQAGVSTSNNSAMIPNKEVTDLFMAPNRRHIIYFLRVSLRGDISSQGWLTPDAALSGTTVALVVTDEAMQEISEAKANGNKGIFPESFVSYAMIFQKPPAERLSTTLSRLTTHNRAYKIDVFKKTRSYDKKTWLSDNGAFLQKQFKLMLENLAEGLVSASY